MGRDQILCGALNINDIGNVITLLFSMGTFTLTLFVVVVALVNGADTTAFGCENSLITDEWREMILKFHNDKREIVAMGQQTDKSGKNLPQAEKMYKMVRSR
ncbi:hypothetical protein Y032_0272g936 [Ancylostoma ceylanicum]|uniref:SCP domain-containing protein n=2 Tax=Ancylostoma ceylanicum TaxID=53326 RepID=A0A016S926_9BILA|nr:hypothetical protein Y032_0272g936 [Ancylostoma ceylanicum]